MFQQTAFHALQSVMVRAPATEWWCSRSSNSDFPAVAATTAAEAAPAATAAAAATGAAVWAVAAAAVAVNGRSWSSTCSFRLAVAAGVGGECADSE